VGAGRVLASPQVAARPLLRRSGGGACRALRRGEARSPLAVRAGRMAGGRQARTKRDSPDVVQKSFSAFHDRDLEGAGALLDDDIVYEDLIYAEPFRGKAAVRAHLERNMQKLPSGMEFVIVDTTGTSADGTRCGTLWKVTLDGADFPFGRGSSFHRIDPATGLLVYAVDVPEPAPTKPGNSALSAISAIAALLRVTGYRDKGYPGWTERAAEPASSNPSGLSSVTTSRTWWLLFYAAYCFMLLLDPDTPGDPVYETSPETLGALVEQSLQFFFIVPALSLSGVDLTGFLGPVADKHLAPEALALFNFSNAYSLLFAGIVFSDSRNRGRRWLWWGQMFLTNLFFIPYLASRGDGSSQKDEDWPPSRFDQAMASPSVGVIGGLVGAASIAWLLFAYAEFGAPEGRLSRLAAYVASDRPAFAFCVDLILYAFFQIYLLRDPAAQGIGSGRGSSRDSNPLRFVPFFGLAWYVAAGDADGSST